MQGSQQGGKKWSKAEMKNIHLLKGNHMEMSQWE